MEVLKNQFGSDWRSFAEGLGSRQVLLDDLAIYSAEDLRQASGPA